MRLLNGDADFDWLAEAKGEVTVFLLAAPRPATASVPYHRVHPLKPRVEVHRHVSVVCLQVEVEPAHEQQQGIMGMCRALWVL